MRLDRGVSKPVTPPPAPTDLPSDVVIDVADATITREGNQLLSAVSWRR